MFRHIRLSLAVLASVSALVLPLGVAAAAAGPAAAGSDISVKRWDSVRDFAHGKADNIRPNREGGLGIRQHSRDTATYTDPFGDGTAKTYDIGSWTSPVVELSYAGDEAIASWNAETPTGTFVETTFRGQLADGSWTKWYVMGRWASGDDFAAGDIHRTSLDGQNDENAAIYTDTFSVRSGKEISAYQAKVTLYRPHGSDITPQLDALAVVSNEFIDDHEGTSAFTLGKQVELDVPPYAQNIHKGEYPEYGGGGEVWCSPTSSTMVQYYWGDDHQVPATELEGIVAPNGDPQVAYAAINTWDYTYEGAGNWPFNAAYAHQFDLDTFVTRLRSLAEVEKFIEAGIPVITSLSWDLEEMPEAGYETNGHLMVIVGFTADGDPILNDPASNSNANVRSVYTRENFENVWQDATDGVVYIYHPQDVPLPKNIVGSTPNW